MSENVARAEQLLRCERAKDAVDLLVRAVADGDARSAAFLAELRLSGHLIRRDLAEARTWFGRAANMGFADAEPIFVALLANGAGGSRRHWREAVMRLHAGAPHSPWARRQAKLLAGMALTMQGDPLRVPLPQVRSTEPRVETIPGLLTVAECQYLVDRAQGLMQPAQVVDPRTGRLMQDPVRSASSASFPFVLEDPVVHAINRRIAVASGTTYEQGEPLQILHYRPGQEYKLHSDALPAGGQQRAITLLVALNADYQGGETCFPRLDIRWRGQPGDALLFANIDPSGRPAPLAWHAGLPVATGTKYLLSKWIRDAPLDLSGPPGRPL